MSHSIKVAIVDPSDSTRRRMRALFDPVDDITVVGEAQRELQAVALVQETHPDVTLLDISTLDLGSPEIAARIGELVALTRVIVLHERGQERQVLDALGRGVWGHVFKEELTQAGIDQAIRAVARGEAILSPHVAGQMLDHVITNVRATRAEPESVPKRRNLVRESDFFQQITRIPVHWRDKNLHVPLFYYDISSISVGFLTPMDRIRELLPSPRLHPLRLTPWHGMTLITAYNYRDTDIGPYNEVSISFPVTLDKPSPLFSGLLRKLPGIPKSYSHRLPVTTEIARDTGVEVASFPKFLAEIDFESREGFLRCRLARDGRHVLTLAVRELPLEPAERTPLHIITYRETHMLRLDFILSERRQGISRNAAHAQLELGDHPLAEELRQLNLGRMLTCQYSPKFQAIIGPVLESFAG